MKFRSRVGGGVALLAAAALVVAGCAPAQTNPVTPGTDPGSAALPSTGWVAAERDQIRDGGTLTIPIDDPISNFNFDNADAGTVDSDDVSDLFQPDYVRINADGTWRPNPNYVTSMELTSEEPQVVEIKLRPDAVWSDGTPMTVADFAGLFNAKNGKNKDFAPNSTNVFKDIESVEQGDDDKHLVITYAKPNADWASIFDNITPPWVTKDPKSFNESWKDMPYAEDGTTVVSGGPFLLESYDKNAQVMTFVRNPEWWGETPKLEKVVIRVVGRDQVGQAYVNKELDSIEINASVDTLETARQRSDGQIQASQGRTFSHITLNGTAGALTDQAVRQAFAQAMDRAVITEAAIGPLGVAPDTLNSLIFLPGQAGYVDQSAPIAYNLDAAKATLEQAGWVAPSPDAIRTKDGKNLTVRLVVPSENPNSANISQQMQPMAKAAGIDMQIDTVPSADFFTKYISVEDRDFEATLFAWQGTAFPISSTESIYYPADAGQNYSGVTDEQLGPMWAKANAELDPAARVGMANEIDAVIMGMATTIPLFVRPNQVATANGLVNFGAKQFQSYDWENVGWKME